MNFLHIANTQFEEELEDIVRLYTQPHPIISQLEFLPLLYGKNGDGLVTSFNPSSKTALPIHLFDHPGALNYHAIESWGFSPTIAAWAAKHNLRYDMPDWSIVKKVNSKQFSWENSPKLPGSALLFDHHELQIWLTHDQLMPKVLKRCFGVSGKGHLFNFKDVECWAADQFQKGLPIIAEPWVNRVLDFSTQWYIHPNRCIEYLGATICCNSSRGVYRSNIVGPESLLFGSHLHFLEQHQYFARELLQKMVRLQFFGNVGFDAMIYDNIAMQKSTDHQPTASTSLTLHPIVEINARKTMGWVALQVQKTHFPKQIISLSYVGDFSGERVLPSTIVNNEGLLFSFPRQLRINLLSR